MKRKKPRSQSSKPNGTGKPGHPPYVPTAEDAALVEALTGYGIPQEDICRLVINPSTGRGIDGKTLREHYRAQIDKGAVSATSRVIGGLFKNAVTPVPGKYPGGNPLAQIFWLKARAGWRTTDQHVLIPAQPETPQTEDVVQADAMRRVLFALEHNARAPKTIEGESKKVNA